MCFKNRFPKKSDADGKGMNKGYIFNNGEYICQSEEFAKMYVEKLGFFWKVEKQTINTPEEWFYYTDWEELDFEQYYDIEGKEYRICDICKIEIKVYENYNCKNCLPNK